MELRKNNDLPEYNGYYFCLNHKGYVGVCKFIDGKWFYVNDKSNTDAFEDKFYWIDIK